MAQYLGKQRVRIINKYFEPKTIKEPFNERTTANGLLVVNGSSAELKTIEGNTVRCNNLFTVDQNLSAMQGCTFDKDTQTFTAPANSYAFMNSVCKLQKVIPTGTTMSISVFCESGEFTTGNIGIGGYHLESGKNSWQCHVGLKKGTNLSGKVFTQTMKTTDTTTDMLVFFNNTTTVTSEIKFKVVIAEVKTPFLEYQPYFTGLKTVNFQGIECKRADGKKSSILALPEPIECGLGTTIDFENQKIVEKGVTIVLTGEENMRVYLWWSTVGIAFIEILPQYEKRAFGVCEDCIYIGDYAGAEEKIWIGVDNKWMYWTNILNRLGFTSSWVDTANPTDEEKAQALADFKAYLAQRYADGNPVTIRYLASAVQSEIPFTEEQKAVGNKYRVFTGGTETILGDDENKKYVEPTTEIRYREQIGVKWFEAKIGGTKNGA